MHMKVPKTQGGGHIVSHFLCDLAVYTMSSTASTRPRRTALEEHQESPPSNSSSFIQCPILGPLVLENEALLIEHFNHVNGTTYEYMSDLLKSEYDSCHQQGYKLSCSIQAMYDQVEDTSGGWS